MPRDPRPSLSSAQSVPRTVVEEMADALELISETPCETHYDEVDADVDPDTGEPTVDHQCRACVAESALSAFRALFPKDDDG